MADEITPIGIDGVGYEVLTKAVSELLNAYPGLSDEQTISFEGLDDTSGIAFSANNGALIMRETVDIIDHVTQECSYPFFVVYRSASTRPDVKVRIQTFLDSLGKWLCKEPAQVDGETVTLDAYPELANGRQITRVTRANSYGIDPNAKGVQDWLLPVTVTYTNEFDL